MKSDHLDEIIIILMFNKSERRCMTFNIALHDDSKINNEEKEKEPRFKK